MARRVKGSLSTSSSLGESRLIQKVSQSALDLILKVVVQMQPMEQSAGEVCTFVPNVIQLIVSFNMEIDYQVSGPEPYQLNLQMHLVISASRRNKLKTILKSIHHQSGAATLIHAQSVLVAAPVLSLHSVRSNKCAVLINPVTVWKLQSLNLDAVLTPSPELSMVTLQLTT